MGSALEKFKPQTEKRDNLTVEEFADLYREKIELVEDPPIIRTVERYVGCLLLICKLVGIKRIARLTEEKVAAFKQKYLKRGQEKGRDETSVKLTCNSHLRGAAALYSKQMMKAYATAGFVVVNPFEGQLLRRIDSSPTHHFPVNSSIPSGPTRPNSATATRSTCSAQTSEEKEATATPEKQASSGSKNNLLVGCEPDWRKPTS